MADWRLLNTNTDNSMNAMNAFRAGQEMAMQQKRQNALAGYGQDPTGTRNALIGMGDVQTAGQLQGYENDQARRQQQQVEYDQGQEDRLKGLALQTAKAMRSLPLEQRAAMYQSEAIPILQRLKVPQQAIDQVLIDGKLTDEELDYFVQQFGGELENLQGVNLGNGGYGTFNPNRYDPQGAFSVVRQPEADQNADLERTLLEARIAATQAQVGQRNAAAAKARRPAAGGKAAAPAGGLSGMSTAALLEALKNAD